MSGSHTVGGSTRQIIPSMAEVDAVLTAGGISAWAVASNEPAMDLAPDLPRAISLAVAYRSAALDGVADGPTRAYYDDYRRLNETLNAAATSLVGFLVEAGWRASCVEATLEDYDAVQDWGRAGVFAHKTAATRAGMGWIGKTALFVSPVLGPKLRLATVFTDLDLPPGSPIDAGRCGRCRLCVDACPVNAGRDVTWEAGMERDLLFDEKACETYLDGFAELGGVCGICVAVCPFGRRALRQEAASV